MKYICTELDQYGGEEAVIDMPGDTIQTVTYLGMWNWHVHRTHGYNDWKLDGQKGSH